jgi:hypothetical protein
MNDTDDYVLTERTSIKRFRKQPINSNTIYTEVLSDSGDMHNELYQTTTVWFRPAVDPRLFDIKMPEKAIYGGVAFNMFACFGTGADPLCVDPKGFKTIGTGVTLYSGLQVTQDSRGFEHSPNWYAQIVGLKDAERAGIFIGSSIIDPHDDGEIGVTVFNMGNSVYEIRPRQLIGQLVFNTCHAPDLGSEQHSLAHRFDREFCLFIYCFYDFYFKTSFKKI